MKPPLKTIEEILRDLNGADGTDWVRVDGIWTLLKIRVSDNNVYAGAERLIIVKLFKNIKTGELKSYLAKNLDVPERENL